MKNIMKLATGVAFFCVIASVFKVFFFKYSNDHSDEFYIQKALLYHVSKQRGTVSRLGDNGIYRDFEILPFANVSEFSAKYPNCCTFSRVGVDGETPNFLDSWRYDFWGVVSIKLVFQLVSGDGVEIIEMMNPIGYYMNRSGEVIDELPRN